MANDEKWGPFHRHFASDAIHRDGGPECDQPGKPRPVYVFDPDYLDEHDEAIRADERASLRHSVETLGGYIRKPDEYVSVGVILMLIDGKSHGR